MPPRTRGQRTTVKTAAIATSADVSTHSTSKKEKRKKTHLKLPPLVIRRPRGHAEEPAVVVGKRALSQEEGPSNAEAQTFSKPAKRVKAALEELRPPHLELTDDEDKETSLGHVPPSTSLKKQKAVMSHTSVGKAQLRRKTLLTENGSDFGDSSSLDNNISHSSEAELSDYDSGVSDTFFEPAPSQTDQVSRKMAFERPIWPSSPGEKPAETSPRWRHHSATSESQRGRSKRTPSMNNHIPAPGSAGTSIEGEQAGRADFRHAQIPAPRSAGISIEGQQAAHADSQQAQITAPRTTATTPDIFTNAGHPTSTRSTQVSRVWPEDTDLRLGSGKLRLTDQTSIVRAIISESFELLHALIIMKHAFPDSLVANKFIEEALSTAALQVPNAEDIHVRILQDHAYCSTMSALPRARISIFRAEVKECCVASVAPLIGVLNHSSAAETAEHVAKLQADFNYIFPRRLATNPNALIGLPQVSRPYRSTIITSVIRDLFFTGNKPFVKRHQDQFPSHRGIEGETIWEVPKAMVALVSTAYYAALSEWSTGERKQHDFTANMFLDAYGCHIVSLEKIENLRNPSYHKMMADIYQLAAASGTGVPPPLLTPLLDLSLLED